MPGRARVTDHVEEFPSEVRSRLEDYLAHMDRELPGILVGCYAVGSLALGDFSRVSNIDLVAVADETWDDTRLAKAGTAAAALRRRGRPPSVAHVSWAELDCEPPSPRAGQPGIGGAGSLNPLNRYLVGTGAPPVRGPERPDVELRQGDIETWAADEMRARWAPVVHAARRPAALWMKRALADPVLDACRLYVATTGRYLSKVAAAETLLVELPPAEGIQRVLREALSYWEGSSTSMYWGPVSRKKDALRLLSELLERVARPRP